MNKELEALDELERFVNEDIGIKSHKESGWHLADKKEFHLIKSALERKEKLEKFVAIFNKKGCLYHFCNERGKIGQEVYQLDKDDLNEKETELIEEMLEK